MTMIGKSRPVRAAALRRSSANRCSSPGTSLAGTECLDIFSPAPGDREVISQALRDSSIETKIAPRSVRIAACAGRRVSLSIIGSRVGTSATSLSRSEGRQPNAHRIFLRKPGVVDNPGFDRAAAFDDRQGHLLYPAETPLIRPRRGGDEMQQRLVLGRDPGRCRYRRDRLDALALFRQQQAPAVITQRLRPIRVPHHLSERLDIGTKAFLPVIAHAPFPQENALRVARTVTLEQAIS